MAAASVSSRSVQAKFAADENILVEIKDNHPGMLRSFAKSAGSEPSLDDYKQMERDVNEIRQLVAEMSGLKNITLMATLENTSEIFIPFLAALTKKLGSSNFIYTDVHGEADIEHSNQFIWALNHEKEFYEDPDKVIDSTIEKTVIFLENIFEN